MKSLSGVALATLTLSCASASEAPRDLDSHEHGAATLDLVVDGATLYLDFASPWINLVGFEHAPDSDVQRTQIDDALALLAQPSTVLRFDGGDCVPGTVDIDNSMQGDAEHADDRHSGVRVSWQFECADPASLTAIELLLFERFPGIDDLDVQMAGPAGQTGMELDPGSPRIDLAAIR